MDDTSAEIRGSNDGWRGGAERRGGEKNAIHLAWDSSMHD